MTTAEILSKAKELGEFIAESAEVKKLIATQEVLAVDAVAQGLLDEYNELQQNYQSAYQLRDEATMGNLREVMKVKSEVFGTNESISKYATAKEELDKLITQVNNVISFHMSGGVEGYDESEGCDSCGSGGCGSSGDGGGGCGCGCGC